MSYLKIAPQDLHKTKNKIIGLNDSDDEEDDEDVDDKEHFHKMTVSDNWDIARTIYSTF